MKNFTKNFVKNAGKKTAAFTFTACAVLGMLVAGGITVAAVAGHEHRAGHFAERIAEKLSLTETQEERLEKMIEAAADKRKELRKQTREQIRAAILQESLSKEDALRLMEIQKEKREEMKHYAAGQFAAFHAGLNGEQREKLAEAAPRLLKIFGGGKRKRHGERRRKERNWH